MYKEFEANAKEMANNLPFPEFDNHGALRREGADFEERP